MKKRILFVFIDLAFVFLAFLVMAWIKPATTSKVIPFYAQPFLIFLVVWFVSSLVTKKYVFQKGVSFRNTFASILISNATVTAIISTLIYFYSLFGYSRLIVFGTIILATIIEMILAIIYKSIISAKSIDPEDDIRKLFKAGERRDKSLVSQKVSLEVEKHKNGQHNEIPGSLQYLIKTEYSEEVLNYISRFATPDIGLKNVVSTSSRFNILALPANKLSCLINIHRINDIQYVNKFFEAVNSKLSKDGILIGKVETYSLRKKRILKKYKYPFNYVYYSLDFIFKRIFPKIPGINKIYFAFTRGRNRLLSKAETLGRLYSCGFKVVDEQLIGNELYFVAMKNGNPSFPKNPTYGPLVKLNRIGKNGKMFGVYKMRTMHPFSEYLQSYIYEKYKLQDGGKFKDDFRISTLGSFMRKVWLDELPMFLNILRGDMKIVGVRPLSHQYFDLYDKALQEKRIKFKPGLIPPFYADMPKTLQDIMDSEMRYLNAYEKNPLQTDVKYFFKAWKNIVFKRARSN